MKFSATEAAFEGFRVVRRNPMTIIAWSLVYLALSLANVFATGRSASALQDLTAAMEAMESSPPTSMDSFLPVMNAYGDMMSGMAWVFPLSIIVSAILAAAVARAVLAPDDGKAFGHVRLGMDEVRVFVVTLVISILSVLAMVVTFVAAAVLGGVAVSMLEGWGWLVTVLLFLGAIAFIIWLAVRWSLAVPITVAEKRFAIFDSFAVTKGRFWPLLGMALIAGVMALVILLLTMIVVMPLSLMSGISMMGAGGDPAEMMANYTLANPWILATAAVNAVIYALMVGVLYAPFAAAYRDIKAG